MERITLRVYDVKNHSWTSVTFDRPQDLMFYVDLHEPEGVTHVGSFGTIDTGEQQGVGFWPNTDLPYHFDTFGDESQDTGLNIEDSPEDGGFNVLRTIENDK